ncbi:MAG: MBL fold metallo-hydrolase [Planctomycetota bacterium]
MSLLEIYPLGVGKGADGVLSGACSSSFVLLADQKPVLLYDLGFGVTRAFQKQFGPISCKIFVSHNHSDHAAELPVVGAVARNQGRRLVLISERRVMRTLKNHRLHELESTGLPLDDFYEFVEVEEGKEHPLTSEISIVPVKGCHSELSFGLIVSYLGQPILGVSGDSAFSDSLYEKLCVARTLIIDGRQTGNAEHAGFEDLESWAAEHPAFKIFVSGYGEPPDQIKNLELLVPGKRIEIHSRL